MKKRVLLLFLFLFLLVGCNQATTDVPVTTEGETGLIELRVFNDKIQWKYELDDAWTDLVALSTLTGPAGEDGKAVLFRVNEDFIQWQREGDSTWTSLFDIASLQGLGVESMLINENGELVITYTDSTVSNLGELNKLNLVQFKDGSGNVISVQMIKDGEDAIVPPWISPLEGHYFAGWDKSFSNVTSDLVINAVFMAESYTITFEANGGDSIIGGHIYDYGVEVTLPIPTRFGYRFIGWYMGETANSPKATDGMILTSDLTLYARWQKETAVTVTNEEELRLALEDLSVDEIIFGDDIEVNQELFINRSLKIDGNGYQLLSGSLYDLFYVYHDDDTFDYKFSAPSGGYLEIIDLDIVLDTGIIDYYAYSAFYFDYIYHMDIRFNNISITGNFEAAIQITNCSDIDFTLVDSFFDVNFIGISGYMNEFMDLKIVNSTIKSNVAFDFGEYQDSSIRVSDSEFYIKDYYDEGGSVFLNYSSGNSSYAFTDSEFYLEGNEVSAIIRSVFEAGYQIAIFDNCYFETNNPFYEDMFYTDGSSDYYINGSVLEFKDGVTDIEDYAYSNNQFSRIILPETIEVIGNHAFEDSFNLVNIVIPEGVTSIGEYAFAGNYSLGSLVVPTSVTYIGNRAFYDSSLNLVLFFIEGVDTTGFDMEWDDFEGFAYFNAKGISYQDGLAYIILDGDFAVVIGYDCVEKDIIVPRVIEFKDAPADVVGINAYAFANQSTLRSIYIPNSIEMIDRGAFYYADKLRSVEFEANSELEYIGYEAFKDCKSLESIFIPASVTYLGDYAFEGNYNLKEVIFGDGINLDMIRTNTFAYNENLRSIEIPASVQIIAQNAFSNNYKLSSLTFEEGSTLTDIGIYAFSSIYGLTEVHLPESLITIASFAFYDNMNLETVDFGDNPSLLVISNSVFAQDYKLSNIVIPSTVTNIGNDVFRDCSSLTTINVPAGILTLGSGFCFNCTNLTNVIFEEDSSLLVIGSFAFYYNDSLTNITLPDSVTTLGTSIFSHCGNLTEITIPASVTSIPQQAFAYNSSLTSITFENPYNITSIGAWAFTFCSELEEIFIADTVITMGNDVFYNCHLLTISVEFTSIPPGWNSTWLGNGVATVIWGVNHRLMTLDLDNGEPNIVIYEKIGTIIPQPEDPLKVDYTFIGWFIFDGVDWVPYTFTTMPEEDVTIKAFWVLN